MCDGVTPKKKGEGYYDMIKRNRKKVRKKMPRPFFGR